MTAYLSYVHFSGLPVYCSESGGCETVQSSEYSKLVGIPVALLGFILYASIFSTGLLAVRGAGSFGQVAPFLVFALALFGVLYSAYLTWLELYRIHAICAWCVASACVLTVLFAVAAAEIVISGRLHDTDESPD